jgi:hypothetical protein
MYFLQLSAIIEQQQSCASELRPPLHSPLEAAHKIDWLP